MSSYVVISLSHDVIFVVIMSFVSMIEYMMFAICVIDDVAQVVLSSISSGVTVVIMVPR